MSWRSGPTRAALAALAIGLASCRTAVSPTPGGSASTLAPSVGPSIGPLDLAGLTGQIVFSAGSEGNEDIYVIEANGTGLRRLTTDPAIDMDPTWSADGRRIAWRTLRVGEDEIFVMDADGSSVSNLTADPAEDYAPAWAPDEALVAFVSAGAGLPDVWVIDPQNGDRRRVTGDIGGEYPSWSPDGRRLVYVVDTDNDPAVPAPRGGWDLYVIGADGSGTVRLTTGEGSEKDPAWSPDGTEIAFEARFEQHDRPDLWLISPDGASLRRLTYDGGYLPGWSPDGRFLVYSRANQLAILSRDGTRRAYLPTPGLEEPVFADWTS